MLRKQLLILITCFVVQAVSAEETATTEIAPSSSTPAKSSPTPTPTPETLKARSFVSPVYEKTIKGDFNKIYQQVFTALENNSYFIVFEPNIGKQLRRFKQRWGDNYNKNNIENIRSMVFCNNWYTNEISNQAPRLLALCPMHITMTGRQGMVSILFIRPSQVARGSPAEKVAMEIEQDVVRSIEDGLSR